MTDALDFVKWLYDKGYVPNSSYLWFDRRAHRNDVVFFKIEELYKVFNMRPQKEQDGNEILGRHRPYGHDLREIKPPHL